MLGVDGEERGKWLCVCDFENMFEDEELAGNGFVSIAQLVRARDC